jgi:hypothetical protein
MGRRDVAARPVEPGTMLGRRGGRRSDGSSVRRTRQRMRRRTYARDVIVSHYLSRVPVLGPDSPAANVPTPYPPSPLPSPSPPPATPPDAPEPPIGPKNFLDMLALPPGDEKRCKEFRDCLKTIELELCPVCEELAFNSDVGPVPELDWRALPDYVEREGEKEASEGGDDGMDVEEEEKVVCKRCRAHLTTNRKAMVKEADGGPPAKPLKFSKANNSLFGTSHNLASEIMLRD